MSIIGLKYYLKNPSKIFDFFASRGLLRFLSDKTFLKRKYKNVFKKKLDLKNPKTFNEKLQWLKLYDRKPEYTMMVDKYEVKKYIAETIGEEYVIPTLGVWDRFEDIDFDKLPNQFVLKCTHDSGGLVICRDKSKLDIAKTKKKIKKSLKRNYYWLGREWPYKNVKPRIIAEEYMADLNGESTDYKIMCFNGEPKIIQVHTGRFTNHIQNFYDVNCSKLNFEQGCKSSNDVLSKTKELEKVINFSRILASNIVHVRVDWYILNKNIFFGEITFYDGGGFISFEPEKWDLIIGKMIDLGGE